MFTTFHFFIYLFHSTGPSGYEPGGLLPFSFQAFPDTVFRNRSTGRLQNAPLHVKIPTELIRSEFETFLGESEKKRTGNRTLFS